MKIKGSQNIAIIGAGYWGKNLARNFYELGALHTICEKKVSLLSNYKMQYPDINLTDNFSDILKDSTIDSVVIVTEAFHHYKLVKQALLRGKDVFVEKPMCLNLEEAEELVAIAESKKLVLMVGHILHYSPCIGYLKKMLTNGNLGDLRYLYAMRLNLGVVSLGENALWNFAPHDISLFLSLCGALPIDVRCVGSASLSKNVVDTSLLTMRFENDISAHIHVSWVNPCKERKLTLVGTKGMAVFDDTQNWDHKLAYYPEPFQKAGIVPTFQHVDYIKMDEKEPLREECSHFLNCCLNRESPKTDGREGLQVLQVLNAAQESMEEGGEIKTVDHSKIYALCSSS